MRTALLLRFGLALALSGSLAACLQPVNTPSWGRAGVSGSHFADINVSRIDGFLGHILQSELVFLFGNGAHNPNARYALNVKTTSSKATSIVDNFNASVQSVSVQVEAVYELKDTTTGKLKGSGKTFASSSYDRSSQRFATLRAQRDAEEKAAKLLAERLRIIIIGLLRSPENGAAGPAPALTVSPEGGLTDPSETE